MRNQMMAHGGLQHLLRNALAQLQVGEQKKIVNYGFARADIQECCDHELPLMKFSVSESFIEGNNVVRSIERIA